MGLILSGNCLIFRTSLTTITQKRKLKVRVSTQFACTEDELWQKIAEPSSLQVVSSPILRFVQQNEADLEAEWQVNRPYSLKLYLLKFIPLGEHTITLVKIDRERNRIISRESGQLATVWNHMISFYEVEPWLVHYTDEIEIKAGWLTPAIWLFAHLFYRHRQRRWKKLLKSEDS